MALVSDNIIIGAADIYLGARDADAITIWTADGQAQVPTTNPYVSAKTTLEASADWTHVGLTQEGVNISYTPTYGEVEVDQFLDAAKMYREGQTMSIGTTLVEATLENLVIAWGLTDDALVENVSPTDTIARTLTVGATAEEPVERKIYVVGRAPTDGLAAGERSERILFATRVIQVEASDFSLQKNGATTYPVNFRVLPETENLANPDEYTYVQIIDRIWTPEA